MIRIAVDFDGTVAEGRPLRLRHGAREALQAIRRAGNRLILYSARSTPPSEIADPAEVERFYLRGEVPVRATDQWALFEEMRTFLTAEGLWSAFDEVWQAPGKPHAELFIDDLAEQPDWPALTRELGVISAHA